MPNNSSKIFSGYRALGINSDHVPCVIRYNKKHQETYVITSVGKAFHVYKCSNLGLVRVSDTLDDEISCLDVDTTHIYAASKRNVYAFRFGRKIVKTFAGHEADIESILVFASQLISVDENNCLKIWNIDSTEIYLSLNFSADTFKITCMMHPVTYLNKILFGSKQGSMQLWNVKSSQLIYTFKSFNSAITIIRQAPAIDVVGVGLENGKIIIHNLKFDETIMSFTQEWGPIRSLTFRTDGNPIMISGSHLGHMAIWNLEEKKLIAQLRESHNGSVDGMHSLQLEPLMVTSSADNSLKVWIFDMSDGSARLLRQRHGHSLPPTRIRFHDLNGQNILSAGLDSCLMSFSTDHDRKNKSLGRASFNKVETRKTGLKLDQHMMPPIVEFDSSESKQSDWDSIVCIHENLRMATTWDYVRSTMGKHKLDNNRFKENEKLHSTTIATCCTVTSCGNYCLIGYSSGHVDLYNMQSGIFRGTYGIPSAHDCSVRGVACDALNLTTITCAENGEVVFWPFKEKKVLQSQIKNCKNKIELNEAINQIILHRESGMLAVATDDFSVLVIDCDVMKVVRKFSGHSNKISDMAFSADSRWLVTSSMDCLLKVWDLPSGKLIDCFKFDKAPTSICFSPTSEFLATTHINELGVYLWSNKTLYSHVPLKPLDENYEPSNVIQMPVTADVSSLSTSDKQSNQEQGMDTNDEDDYDDYKNYTSPEQLAYELVTLSLLPESRWKNLVNLDIIKQRNKPKEPPKKPKLAPFFLPTIANEQGFTFKTGIEAKEENKTARKDLSNIESIFMTDFANKLLKSNKIDQYNEILADLKKMGPSAIDLEVRSMSLDMGGSVEMLQKFLQFILFLLSTRKNFELANSYLALFLKVHGDVISSEKVLVDILEQIKEMQELAWTNLKTNMNKNLCMVSYLKSVT